MTDNRWHELHNLINGLLEGELTEEGSERLAVWLSIDEEAQTYYARALQLHSALALEFFDEAEQNLVESTSAYETALSLTRPSSASKPMATVAEREEHDLVKVAYTRTAAICRRLTALSGSVIGACLAVMLAVVAVYGSERLISEVLSARRASTADRSSGMIVSSGEAKRHEYLRQANERNGTRRVGSSGHEGVALASVFLFPLPPMSELEEIEAVKLEWTYKRKDGDPQFYVDLYGLGFVKPRSLGKLGFWEGPTDKASRHTYGMAGSTERRVTLIQHGVMKPQTPCGRISIESRELVRFLQSLYDDGAREGDLAVFRLNADHPTSRIERETGYAVVHPPSLEGLTTPDELPVMTVVTTKSDLRGHGPVLAEAVMASHSVSEHWSGGLVRSFNNIVQSGPNSDGTRRVGSSVTEGVGLVNVFVFSLPSVEELDGIVSVRLQWTLASKDNSPDFTVDLYGLGYLRGESYHGPCFWEGLNDLSSPADYGLRGNSTHVSLIARHAMRPGTHCGPVAIENLALVEYLRSLYDDGAQEGDLVIFRLNANVSTLEITRGTGYSVIHAPEISGRTSETDLPTLLMTFN